jgi:zinc transport system substrate-binding protein
MVRRYGVLLLAAWAGAMLLSACRNRPEVEPVMRIVVSIPPLRSLIAALAPPGCEIRILLPPGRSEHGYEFTASDLAAIKRANILVLNGAGLDSEHKIEKYIKEHREPNRVEVSFANAIGISGPPGSEEDEDDQDEGEEHTHSGDDPHLWLDPVLVEKFIPALRGAVRDAQLKKGAIGVQEQERLEAAAIALEKDVRAVHKHGKERLAKHHGESLVTHHDAWRRLAERYGMEVAAVIRPIETAEPTVAAIAAAEDVIKRQGINAIFVEPQFSKTAADKISQRTGAKVSQIDPLGDGDWAKMMRSNIDIIAETLSMEKRVRPGQPAGEVR